MLNDLDRALMEHDVALPALQSLLDTTQMERLVAERVDPEMEFSLGAGYLRYNAGVSCLARYQVKTTKGTAWAYAKAFSHDAAAKYEKLKSLDTRPGLLGPGRLFFDDQKLVFSIFPNDSRLRVLSRLEGAEFSADTYGKIFKGMGGWTQPEYQVLSYKPERRLAARFSNANGGHLLVKFYEADEFERIRKYRKRLSTPAELPIQKWIGGSKSHNALVFSWLEGQSLARQVEDHVAYLAPGCFIGLLVTDDTDQFFKLSTPHPEFAIQRGVGKALGEPVRGLPDTALA